MYYHVWYDPGYNEGWELNIFDNLAKALKFAEEQVQSEIYKVDQGGIPLAYNINLNIS